jgi:hypothetical protein
MRRIFTLLFLFAAACASSPDEPAYAPGDPLGEKQKPTTIYREIVDPLPKKIPLIRAIVPEGYRTSEGSLHSPVIALFSKEVYGGEASIVVERYTEADGNATDQELFWRNLAGKGNAPSAHKIGEKNFSVRHDLRFERSVRRISPGDPYADYLGTGHAPPRLSLVEKRRFLVGGDAYRLYRCRKLSAWGILADYRRARDKKRLSEFFQNSLKASDRKILSACFGKTVLMSIGRGEAIPDIPKPGMYRLKIMAREERDGLTVRMIERECVYVTDVAGGFAVVRLRAPESQFKAEHKAFETFLASFVYF